MRRKLSDIVFPKDMTIQELAVRLGIIAVTSLTIAFTVVYIVNNKKFEPKSDMVMVSQTEIDNLCEAIKHRDAEIAMLETHFDEMMIEYEKLQDTVPVLREKIDNLEKAIIVGITIEVLKEVINRENQKLSEPDKKLLQDFKKGYGEGVPRETTE